MAPLEPTNMTNEFELKSNEKSIQSDLSVCAILRCDAFPTPGVSWAGETVFPTVWTPVPAVSRPWVPACGPLEPPCRDGENAQKMGENGGKWARYGLKGVKESGSPGCGGPAPPPSSCRSTWPCTSRSSRGWISWHSENGGLQFINDRFNSIQFNSI